MRLGESTIESIIAALLAGVAILYFGFGWSVIGIAASASAISYLLGAFVGALRTRRQYEASAQRAEQRHGHEVASYQNEISYLQDELYESSREKYGVLNDLKKQRKQRGRDKQNIQTILGLREEYSDQRRRTRPAKQ